MADRKVSRRDALKGLAIAGAAGPGLFTAATASAASENVTRFPISGSKLKILAVTDLHFFCRTPLHDRMTLKIIRRMLDRFQPDLIIADGDVWHNNPRGMGLRFCEWTCEKLGALGVPWAFVRGNHDLADDFGECEKLLAAAPNSLFSGVGTNANYRIDVIDQNGEAAWRMIVLNDSAPKLGFDDYRIELLNQEAARIRAEKNPDAPAFLFCHIPLIAFEEMVRQGRAKGIMLEKVCYEQGVPESLQAVRDVGIIKAVYCGHEHIDDYEGEMEGVHLEYLRSTGYGGYGNLKIKKGGTIIDVDVANKSFESISVFGDGTSWEPSEKPKLVVK